LLVAHPGWAACTRTCASRPEGCAKGFGTLAYVVSTCRVVPGGKQLGAQELRIHRSGCDPVTVLRVANAEPAADSLGLCAILGTNHQGTSSPVAGVFHRIGVTRDGRAVVFEINNAFQLIGRLPLAAEEQGFFYVRADGTGLRHLGPPSRDPTYRIFFIPDGASAAVATQLHFSSDHRRVAFTDLAPGPDGVETEQIFTLELATGERRQVTHLTAGEPPPPGRRTIDPPSFLTPRIIDFTHNVGDRSEPQQIDIDGTNLRRPELPDGPSLGGGGEVVQVIRRSRRDYGIFGVRFPGQAANDPSAMPTELFRNISNRHALQLTNFGHSDTGAFGGRHADLLFYTSADPLGENRFNTCQLFRISPLATGLRQLTHFDEGRPSREGCDITVRPGCGLLGVNQFSHSQRAITFFSDCNPLGTNPDGAQVFAMRWNGARMRQLTHTRGVTLAPDGSVLEVEIPGPVARGGPR
jgi:hypothetical protein